MLSQSRNAIRRFSTHMISEFVKFSEKGAMSVITLDRPQALNAISGDMFKTLYHNLKSLEKEKSHVLLKAAGDKVFCAGGDIKLVSSSPMNVAMEIFCYTFRNFDLVASYRKPYISFMNGLTMGGASPFTVAGRHNVATEKTAFAMPETIIGFFNDAGASFFLSRIRNNLGLYLGMTGERLKSLDVWKSGLARHYVESDRLAELEESLAACKTNEEIEKAINKMSSVPKSTETELDAILPRIEKCFGGKTVEEIYENLNKDGSAWAMKTIETLNRLSPTSLKVTHRSITTGKHKTMRDCLKMEYQVCRQFLIESDLREGVRAILLDKDFKPKWNPGSVEGVTEKMVENFFKNQGEELTFEER